MWSAICRNSGYPLIGYWNFVSSSKGRLAQAAADWRAGQRQLLGFTYAQAAPSITSATGIHEIEGLRRGAWMRHFPRAKSVSGYRSAKTPADNLREHRDNISLSAETSRWRKTPRTVWCATQSGANGSRDGFPL